MNYIKIDYSHLKEYEENYIYLLELNNNNMVERQIIINISKDKQQINKLVYSNASGNFKWKDYKFDNSEIEKNNIPKEEFDKYWQNK